MKLRREERARGWRRQTAMERVAGRYVETSDGIVRIKHGGNGLPSVVFVGGIGEGTNDWTEVLNGVSEFTHAISYDRVGLGLSGPAAAERDSFHVASELRNLLSALHEAAAPVVLVSHSAGAFHARMFAHRFPDLIAGLVFVEPGDEDWLPMLKEADPKAWLRHQQWRNSSRHSAGRKRELAAWDTIVQQMREIGRQLPPCATVLISATAGNSTSTDVLFQLHQRWAAMLPSARHEVTNAAGHHVHRDAPAIIVREVEAIVANVQFRR